MKIFCKKYEKKILKYTSEKIPKEIEKEIIENIVKECHSIFNDFKLQRKVCLKKITSNPLNKTNVFNHFVTFLLFIVIACACVVIVSS